MRRSALVLVPAILSMAVAVPVQATTILLHSCMVNGFRTIMEQVGTKYHVHGIDQGDGTTQIDVYVTTLSQASYLYYNVCGGV